MKHLCGYRRGPGWPPGRKIGWVSLKKYDLRSSFLTKCRSFRCCCSRPYLPSRWQPWPLPARRRHRVYVCVRRAQPPRVELVSCALVSVAACDARAVRHFTTVRLCRCSVHLAPLSARDCILFLHLQQLRCPCHQCMSSVACECAFARAGVGSAMPWETTACTDLRGAERCGSRIGSLLVRIEWRSGMWCPLYLRLTDSD